MSREVLEKMKVSELASLCKEKNIPHYRGKTRFRKDEMIEAILKDESVEEKIEIEAEAGVVAKEEKETTSIQQLPGTKEYLEKIQVGTLVAFKEASGKLNTAMVKNASFKRQQLRLVTQYDKEFIVPFDDVIWVRTTGRWPRFVLDALKQQQRRLQNGTAAREK